MNVYDPIQTALLMRAPESLFELAGFAQAPSGVVPAVALLAPGESLNFSETDPSTPVPEPASLMLIGSGLLGLAGCVMHRPQAKKSSCPLPRIAIPCKAIIAWKGKPS